VEKRGNGISETQLGKGDGFEEIENKNDSNKNFGRRKPTNFRIDPKSTLKMY
jgi:hypothetical protein